MKVYFIRFIVEREIHVFYAGKYDLFYDIIVFPIL